MPAPNNGVAALEEPRYLVLRARLSSHPRACLFVDSVNAVVNVCWQEPPVCKYRGADRHDSVLMRKEARRNGTTYAMAHQRQVR